MNFVLHGAPVSSGITSSETTTFTGTDSSITPPSAALAAVIMS